MSWYTEKDGGELVEAGTEVSDKAAHTLYAHWTLTKVFSVTVPAGLLLAVTEDGVVTSSTDAAIANNSTCDVRVTAISLKTENGWTLVPFEYNMAAAKVDSKLIGFAIGGAVSTAEATLNPSPSPATGASTRALPFRWTTTPPSPPPPSA